MTLRGAAHALLGAMEWMRCGFHGSPNTIRRSTTGRGALMRLKSCHAMRFIAFKEVSRLYALDG